MSDRSLGFKLNRELKKWNELATALAGEQDVDLETIIDTCDGETELMEVLQIIQESIFDRKFMIEGIDSAIASLNSRKSRLNNTNETMKNVILRTMDQTGIDTVSGPLFTISKKTTPAKLIITEESDIPSEYFVPQDPKLDKKALLAAVKDGEVKGAELSNGGITIQVRIK